MGADLGFSDRVYGLEDGIFCVTLMSYFEIPWGFGEALQDGYIAWNVLDSSKFFIRQPHGAAARRRCVQPVTMRRPDSS
jgi:hypothetical protein